MTAKDKDALAFLIPKIDAALPEDATEGRAALTLLQGILLNSHGAASHSPKTRRARRPAAAGDVDEGARP
jgi:hypothetical protein